MDDLGRILGWISFVLLGIWRVYWFVTEQKAEKEKPKTEKLTSSFNKKTWSKFVTLFAFGVVGVQLLGIRLLPFPEPQPILQVIGFLLVITGLGIAILGRKELGTNWANCYEYQVKPKQVLVTSGIYSLIRHPLYSGIALFFIGSELVVQSYLLVPYLLLAFPAANMQAKWEETLLTKHFGEKYKTYMKRTKRFIPFVW